MSVDERSPSPGESIRDLVLRISHSAATDVVARKGVYIGRRRSVRPMHVRISIGWEADMAHLRDVFLAGVRG